MPVPARDPSEPTGEPERPQRGPSGRFLPGHTSLATTAPRGHGKAVARLLMLQALRLPQIRYVETGKLRRWPWHPCLTHRRAARTGLL